ncbi:uncharacterized protein LOC135073127 [Ostrinia nubilalis]|uniref:uncharacterized protein LOC135073127 n=1 Tax=Ostrinia nubilalis TaxID=29057 RepID=UPI003082282F
MNHVWTLIIIIGFYQGASIARQCTAPGKYPNDHVGSCEGFTMCLIAGPGHFAQMNLTCPPGFIYNHVHSQCTNVTSYQCAPEYNCTDIGNFPNPYSDDCFSYIACVEGVNDFITARSIECLEGEIFDAVNGSCVMRNETLFRCHPEEHSSENIEFKVAESVDNSSFRFNSVTYSAVLICSFLFCVI